MEKKAKILVVEDERIVAEDIKNSLIKLGYTVPSVVSSGNIALKKIKEIQPDLVLMDIVLNGEMNGIDTTNQIRSIFDIPVVYLTAYADEKMLEKAKKTEPFGYILKPFEDRELKSTIEMALYKHRMEKKLKESEAWFSTTLKSIGDAVITTDKNGIVIFMNPVAELLTGWKQKEALNIPLKNMFNIFNEITGKKVEDPVTRVIRDGAFFNQTGYITLLTKDSKKIPIDVSSAPIKDARGNIVGIVLVFQDITGRKQTEAALLESEERYRTLFEDSRDAIYITTKDGKFVVANQSTLNLLGYTRVEMAGLNIWDLYVNPDDLKKYRKEIDNKGSVRDYEVRIRSKKGKELDCLITSTVRRAENGKILGYQGIIRDITAHKRAEEEREKIRAQLFQAQKIEAIGILAGGIAHDFNNLMTAIQGFTEMALMQVDEVDPLYKDLKEILVASDRATDLTRQLLLFSRKQPMKFIKLNINRSIEGLLKILHRLIGEDIGISTAFEDRLWAVKADVSNMEQMIMNLAINARDAMPEGGKIIIKTENIELDETYCEIMPEARPGRFVRLSVIDTGIGMDKETVQRIFEPFYTTKVSGKGTGLGLSVAYGIIKQHEGWVNVYSEPGYGTAFKIYLPAFFEKSEEKTEKAIPIKELQGSGERVLVVEDENGVRELTTRALGNNGYVVCTASNTQEALEVFKKEKKNFNLVLSDVVLPDKSGIELVEKLLSSKPSLKVILTSGYTDQRSQWSAIQDRGFKFLQKSYSIADLLKVVKETIKSD